MIYTCGCSSDARFRCALHKDWLCHDPTYPKQTDPHYGPDARGECPVCRMERIRSVTVDGRATPTRRGR